MAKKGKHFSPNVPLQEIIDKGAKMGPLLFAETEAEVKAKGLIINNNTADAKLKQKAVSDLETELDSARIDCATSEATLLVNINLGVDKVNEKFPHDEVKIVALGIDLTEEGHKRPLAEKIFGCSVVQSGHSGKGNMHCHCDKNTDSYMIMETQSTDILNEAVYYPGNPTSFNNSRGGEVIPKDVNKITTFRIFGRNTSGDGIWSDPFGGFPIH